jgi:hypothetical protein
MRDKETETVQKNIVHIGTEVSVRIHLDGFVNFDIGAYNNCEIHYTA